jgi:hypothetical protein
MCIILITSVDVLVVGITLYTVHKGPPLLRGPGEAVGR